MANITGCEIDNKLFWKKRLEDAKKAGHIQYSVYLANDTLWNKIEESHKEILQKLVKQSDKVLDAGCGYGRLAPFFDNYCGIDFIPAFIEEANTLYPNKRFMEADLRKLPFKDKEFDWGLLVSVRHMIVGNLGKAEWVKMENELKRVCKKLLILEYGEFETTEENITSIKKYEIIK